MIIDKNVKLIQKELRRIKNMRDDVMKSYFYNMLKNMSISWLIYWKFD